MTIREYTPKPEIKGSAKDSKTVIGYKKWRLMCITKDAGCSFRPVGQFREGAFDHKGNPMGTFYHEGFDGDDKPRGTIEVAMSRDSLQTYVEDVLTAQGFKNVREEWVRGTKDIGTWIMNVHGDMGIYFNQSPNDRGVTVYRSKNTGMLTVVLTIKNGECRVVFK
jgi:hypothetical protein